MRTLIQRGHRVRAFVRRPEQADVVEREGAEAFVGQITNLKHFVEAARGCEQIHHIAAVFRTAGHPDSYYKEVNVNATLNALEALRMNGCERLIHCSTVGVHGHITQPPASETYPFAPGDIYQCSKLEGELAVAQAAERGMPVVIVRPSPIYGEGDLRLLKLFRAIRNRRFVMVGTGEPKFHLVHISDLIDGFLLCSERPEALRETFILAGPEAPTLNKLVATIAAALGVPPPRLRIPFKPVYAAGWVCEKLCVPLHIEPPLHRRRISFFFNNREFDISKARSHLGYNPRVSLQEGVSRTARWYVEAGRVSAPVLVYQQG
jgi:nucleoside-diphosphate-sugar epimerase